MGLLYLYRLPLRGSCFRVISIGVPRGGGLGVHTPLLPKLFRSFDKAEPNSLFRGKYILRT
jgi:hypothetical protein